MRLIPILGLICYLVSILLWFVWITRTQWYSPIWMISLAGFLAMSWGAFYFTQHHEKRKRQADEPIIRGLINGQIEKQERDPARIANVVYGDLPRDRAVYWRRLAIEHMAASSVAAETVRAIIGMTSSSPYARVAAALADVLPRNPRRRKRVANQILLNSLIADRRQILGPTSSLSIEHVAKWTVLGTLWPSTRDLVILQPKKFVEEECVIRQRPLKGSEDDLVAFLRTDPPLGDCIDMLIYMTEPAQAVTGTSAPRGSPSAAPTESERPTV